MTLWPQACAGGVCVIMAALGLWSAVIHGRRVIVINDKPEMVQFLCFCNFSAAVFLRTICILFSEQFLHFLTLRILKH